MIGSRVAIRGLAARALQPEFQGARVALRQADPPAEAILPMRLRQPEPDFRRGREPARERRKSIAEPDLETALSKRVAIVVRRKPGHGPARQQRVHASIRLGAARAAQGRSGPYRVTQNACPFRIAAADTGRAPAPAPCGRVPANP